MEDDLDGHQEIFLPDIYQKILAVFYTLKTDRSYVSPIIN